MARAPGLKALDRVKDTLLRLLRGAGHVAPMREAAATDSVDLRLHARGVTYAVEWKAAGDAANVGGAVRQLVRLRTAKRRSTKAVVPIVAVPFMGETGRRICTESGVSWLDLSGNAWIDAPGHQIRILGHRNRFLAAGRPANVFAPRSSRVVRALLMEPARSFSQADLALASGVDKGRVSRLVPRLEALGVIRRPGGKGVRLEDPSLALEAWREAYDFEQHAVRRGHVAVRDPDELIELIRTTAPMPWALTGLAAAWQLTHFAMFRLTTVFLREIPEDAWLRSIGFREEPRGANVWLVQPVDDAVFEGATVVAGIPCAHPIQVYLDLKGQPERAPEAAEELKKRLLRWSVE